MKVPFVDLKAQYLSIQSEIDEAMALVINETGFVRSRFVDKFEEDFAKLIGIDHVVSCGNGTDSLYILMRGLGLKAGDEVITTAHSWISTSETITQAGGKVVFCDTDSYTFTIDPVLIESKITSKTVGIIPVHLYGQPADMDPIMAIAKKHNLWVIEDCAQAHLAEYKGRKVGTIGTAGSFSFYPGKNLGAMGDAGCLVTNNLELAKWCELFARHGGKGMHTIEGINSRLDGIQAAILSAKIPFLNKWTARRKELANMYSEKLKNIPQIVTPKIAANRSHVFHLYVINAENRDNLKKHLEINEISTMLNYPKALPFYPAYDHLKHTEMDFPHSFKNQNEIISLPIYPEMQNDAIDFVVAKIKEFYSL
jgi:dTDP-4-amino-4,6-dideoxygalactose transaminase